MDQFTLFTDEFKEVTNQVVKMITGEFAPSNVEVEHVLLGIMAQPTDLLRRAFQDQSVDINSIQRELRARLNERRFARHPLDFPRPTQDMATLLGAARQEAKAIGHTQIGSEHVMLAILKAGVAGFSEVLNESSLSYESLHELIVQSDKED